MEAVEASDNLPPPLESLITQERFPGGTMSEWPIQLVIGLRIDLTYRRF